MHFVYGLIDPDSIRVSYVGRSRDPVQRFRTHIEDDSDSDKARWIKRLNSEGKEPRLIILEECMTEADAIKAERFWITLGEKSGWKLFNTVNSVDLGSHNPRPYNRKRKRKDKIRKGDPTWGLDLTQVPKTVANTFSEFYDPATDNLERGGRAEAKRVLFGYDYAPTGRAATDQGRIVNHFFNMWRAQREKERTSAN